MKSKTREIIQIAVDKWLKSMILSMSEAAATAYSSGSFHATGFLKMGVGFDVLQKEALEYAKTYKKKLTDTGTITITKEVLDSSGKVIGYTVDTEYPWLTTKSADTRNDIASIIERGIAEGKAAGVRIGKNGKYPEGSIAEELHRYFDTKKSEASTVARSETARCYYEGESTRYARAGVEYVEFLGAPDACDACMELIGRKYKLGSEPHIPIHPNCRCDYRPYFPEKGEVVDV